MAFWFHRVNHSGSFQTVPINRLGWTALGSLMALFFVGTFMVIPLIKLDDFPAFITQPKIGFGVIDPYLHNI